MERAIELLCESSYDEIVELVDLEELQADPQGLYERTIFAKGSPLKTMTIWAPEYLATDTNY